MPNRKIVVTAKMKTALTTITLILMTILTVVIKMAKRKQTAKDKMVVPTTPQALIKKTMKTNLA